MRVAKIIVINLLTALILSACVSLPIKPSNIQSENQTKPPAIQPSPRVLTQDGSSLTIPLKIGERVEIEVAGSNMSKAIFSISDPYGNKIAETATRIQTQSRADNYIVVLSLNAQEYPWHFAFIAATNGDYVLHGQSTVPSFLGGVSTNLTAILKATIYP